MRTLLFFLLLPSYLFSCYSLALADQVQAVNKQAHTRYGIEHVKLGFPITPSLKYINSLIKTDLSCSEKKISIGKMRRNFVYKTCKLPKKHPKIEIWDEVLQKINMNFLDNQLVDLSFEFKTTKDYQALYDKHGKRILALLGEPTTIDLDNISWNKQNDKATVEEKKKGIILLHIFNKPLQKILASGVN